jgi:plastocyanin
MSHTRVIAAALAAAALSLSACGGDDDSGGGEPAPLAFTATESGKSSELSAPESVEAGVVEIELQNDGERDHNVQLLRFDEGHDAQEALKAGNAWGDGGKPLPEWVHLAGGTGTVAGGESAKTTVELEPGTYAALDLEAEGPDGPVFAEFEVTGEGGGETPSADATIEATEYEFAFEGLQAGANTVAFENAGEQPHHVAAVAMAEGATIDDVKKFFETEKGRPPIDDSKSFDTAVIDGGGTQVVELDIEAGKYAVLCFVPDREGGPPHAARGMISEVEVK